MTSACKYSIYTGHKHITLKFDLFHLLVLLIILKFDNPN